MSKKNDLSPEERRLFREAMKDVQRLKDEKARFKPKAPKARKGLESAETMTEAEDDVFLEDTGNQNIQGDDYLSFARSGLQKNVLRKLRKGQYPCEAILDLHHKTVAEAREALSVFIRECQNQEIRYVQIIHGKGIRSPSQQAILKNQLNTWLPQFDAVLAFCSAKPKDGGLGAVYVILRRV